MNKRIVYTSLLFSILLVINFILLINPYVTIVKLPFYIYISIDFILSTLLINYDLILRHMDFILNVILFSLFYIMIFTIATLILSNRYPYLENIKLPPSNIILSLFFISGLITSIAIKIKHNKPGINKA